MKVHRIGCLAVKNLLPSTLRAHFFITRIECDIAMAGGESYMFTLVLSSGGILGAAHLGVLRALRDSKLVPSAVVGTSAGGLVAASLASNVALDRLIGFSHDVAQHPQDFFRPNWRGVVGNVWDSPWTSPSTAVFNPRKFITGLADLSETVNNIAQWAIPCVLTSVDIAGFVSVAFSNVSSTPPTTGGPWDVVTDAPSRIALQSTMAIPGVIESPRFNGRVLVDGGITDTWPMDWGHSLGYGPVVAVNVTPRPHRPSGALNILESLSRSQAYAAAASSRARNNHAPAFTIVPDTRDTPFMDFHAFDRLVEIGYQAGRAAIPSLADFLDSRQPAIKRPL